MKEEDDLKVEKKKQKKKNLCMKNVEHLEA